MRVVRYLQHWLRGSGARLQGTDFVPIMHPMRQWAEGALGNSYIPREPLYNRGKSS